MSFISKTLDAVFPDHATPHRGSNFCLPYTAASIRGPWLDLALVRGSALGHDGYE